MNYIKSTYAELTFKALNRDVSELWSEWALQMILNGHETEHLIILAGVSKPYNQFYLQELTSKVFHELSLDYSDQERILRNYSAYLSCDALAGNRKYREVLKELKDICIELNYEKFLFDFYTLFFALDDLEYLQISNGIGRTLQGKNINSVI